MVLIENSVTAWLPVDLWVNMELLFYWLLIEVVSDTKIISAWAVPWFQGLLYCHFFVVVFKKWGVVKSSSFFGEMTLWEFWCIRSIANADCCIGVYIIYRLRYRSIIPFRQVVPHEYKMDCWYQQKNIHSSQLIK